MQNTLLLRLLSAALIVPALGLLLSSCARVPNDLNPNARGKQLVVTMRMEREVRQDYFYFVLINLTDDVADAGPVPIVQGPPWNNGFAAPAPLPANRQGFVGFVRYGTGGYSTFGVARDQNGNLANPTLNQFAFLERPDIILNDPVTGRRDTIAFQLDLSRLPGYVRPGPDGQLNTADDTTARYVQINFLATDSLPVGSVDQFARKTWDALGDGRSGGLNDPVDLGNPGINTYLTLPLDQNVTRTETEANLEPPDNDVRERLDRVLTEPDLNLVDWTVEIRSPSASR